MQSDNKQLYKLTSERTGKSETMYKDLGNFVFAETYILQRNPKSLILKLKGVGSWHLRKKRMEIVVSEFTEFEEKTVEQFDTIYGYESYKERRDRYHIFVDRLKEYEDYLSLKREIRAKRNETQYLLKPIEDNGKFKST